MVQIFPKNIDLSSDSSCYIDLSVPHLKISLSDFDFSLDCDAVKELEALVFKFMGSGAVTGSIWGLHG